MRIAGGGGRTAARRYDSLQRCSVRRVRLGCSRRSGHTEDDRSEGDDDSHARSAKKMPASTESMRIPSDIRTFMSSLGAYTYRKRGIFSYEGLTKKVAANPL
jgi:hypothetical protein